ncbi:MAG: hypothetical protein ACPGTQ_10810 [Colwellia sp.]
MSTFKEKNILISILTRGWIARTFILLLWLAAIILSFIVDSENLKAVVILLASTNGVLYLQLSSRLQSLVGSDMAKVLPNYFDQVKKSLLIILCVSFIPTLVLLPDLTQWLSLLSVLILIAVCAMALSYHPKYYWLLAIFFVTPISIDTLKEPLEPINFKLILSCLLPFIAWFAYELLRKLEYYKGNKTHIKRMKSLSNLSPEKLALTQESMPYTSRHKIWQWLINQNFSHYRESLKKKILPNRKLIEIACQDLDTIGRFTYIVWFCMNILLILIAELTMALGFINMGVFYVISIVVPAAMLFGGTLTTFNGINLKRSLLNRLAIMPCFNEKESFSRAFIAFVVLNQIKFYVFILAMIAVFAFAFGHINMNMYLNIVILACVVCTMNLLIMFITWHAKKSFETLAIWLMSAAFITGPIFLLYMHKNEVVLLFANSSVYLILLAVLAILITRLKVNPEKLFKVA